MEVLNDMKAAVNTNPALTSMMLKDVGIPACSAMINFAEEKYADTVDQLYPIRSIANRFGGSHAQRDILTQTLIEAAIRSGQTGLASNLLSERCVHKPFSPLTKRFSKKMYIKKSALSLEHFSKAEEIPITTSGAANICHALCMECIKYSRMD